MSDINRVGESTYNTFNSIMIITEYINSRNMKIYFPEYDWTCENAMYHNFIKGSIKCPYEPRLYGMGYIGEGPYKSKENKKQTKAYDFWNSMIQRCYSDKFHIKNPAYVDCTVCDNWLNFQNFAEWHKNNYYEISDEIMCLDKDIFVKRNKIYSPDTCIYVPKTINSLFVKNDATRGKYPIGIHKNNNCSSYIVTINNIESNKPIYLGSYKTKSEAFLVYKEAKENHIKAIADKYKDNIPEKLYEALYDYSIDIND